MCGRFSLINIKPETLKEHFGIKNIPTVLKSRYNIAPSNYTPVITNTEPDTIHMMQWGLIPHWAKDKSIGQKLINARAESIKEKPAFKESFYKRRCLVLADSFYEWKKSNGRKKPYRIMLKNNELFAFAGIWDAWYDDTKPVYTFSIITTPANNLINPIHSRMPVILDRNDEKSWINGKNIDEAFRLLKPFNHELMKSYEISTLINNPSSDDARVLNAV